MAYFSCTLADGSVCDGSGVVMAHNGGEALEGGPQELIFIPCPPVMVDPRSGKEGVTGGEVLVE